MALSDGAARARGVAGGPVLTAFYDLAAAPASFDCASFLALAERHRRSRGYGAMRVVFVPAEGRGYWLAAPFPEAERARRLHNLLAPLTRLWPSCIGASLPTTRAEAHEMLRAAGRRRYPGGYRVEAPVADSFQWSNIVAAAACGETIPSWQAPAAARETVARWLEPRSGGRRVVVVTLREASYRRERNSDLAAWGEFARGLDASRYFPVLVRDTKTASQSAPPELAGLHFFPEASLDVTLRAALYERSWLSLMSATGPMMLLWLNPACRSLVFDLLDPRDPTGSPAALRALGLEIGGQMPGLGSGHRLVWQADSREAISAAFAAAVSAAEAAPAKAPIPAAGAKVPPLRIARRLRAAGCFLPARRIYAHEARLRPLSAGPLCGLSLAELEIRRPLRLYRILRGGVFYLAALASGLGRWDSLDEAIEIACCLERWRRPAAAARLYRAILARAPGEAMVLDRLGLLSRAAGRSEEALHLLECAVASDPHSGQYRFDLGETLAAAGRPAEALAQYREAFACNPFHEGIAKRLAESEPPARSR